MGDMRDASDSRAPASVRALAVDDLPGRLPHRWMAATTRSFTFAAFEVMRTRSWSTAAVDPCDEFPHRLHTRLLLLLLLLLPLPLLLLLSLLLLPPPPPPANDDDEEEESEDASSSRPCPSGRSGPPLPEYRNACCVG